MKGSEEKIGASIVGVQATPAQARGRIAEDIAADHLARNGVRILARNVRCRSGEVDIVGLERGTVVFVEVRMRSSIRFGGAAASITPAKQRRVVLAAQWWLAGNATRYAQYPCRFDAVLFDSANAERLDWIRAAFDAI